MRYMCRIEHYLDPFWTSHTDWVECDVDRKTGTPDHNAINAQIERIADNHLEMFPNSKFRIIIPSLAHLAENGVMFETFPNYPEPDTCPEPTPTEHHGRSPQPTFVDQNRRIATSYTTRTIYADARKIVETVALGPNRTNPVSRASVTNIPQGAFRSIFDSSSISGISDMSEQERRSLADFLIVANS